MTTILLISASALIALAEDGSSRGATTNVLSLEQTVAQVLSNSPALASARLKWHSMEERPEIVHALPDPMLTYGYWFQNVETRVGAMNQRVGVAQKIPFFGKRSLAASKATQEALLAMWEYQTLARELVMRSKIAYYDLYRVDRSREILTAQLELLDPIVKTAQSRYEAGKANQQDVLKAQVATTEIQNRLLDLTQQRKAALARLNALRNAPQESELDVFSSLDSPPLPPRQAAFEIAEQYRQELQAAGVAIQRDEIALKLAKKDRWPDFTFGVDYTQINPNIFQNPPDNGQDAVQGFVSINIPLWFGKLKAERREAEQRLEASRAAQENAQNTVSSEVQDAWFRAQVSRDQVTLYETSLLPRAEQTFDASRAGYETAKVSFIDLLDSERALLNFRLGLVMSETDLAKALAALERAVGVDLNDISKWKSTPPQEK
ncbi:MAG TPA: TolC family protein [Verrucomicrobiae bacterium]|nr:TolC family protein [Verrucomicrobiae bacterium]